MIAITCACGNGLNYADCCKPYHTLKNIPKTAEILMRSRYSAYVLHLADYLVATIHPANRHLHKKKDILAWAKANTWVKLEICNADDDVVEFKAYYMHHHNLEIHHERSLFKQEKGKWYYYSGTYF